MMSRVFSGRMLLLVILIVAGVVTFMITTIGTKGETEVGSEEFLANALKSADIVERVYIGEEAYDVSRGVVQKNGSAHTGEETVLALQLAYAKTLARRSPLFGLAGTDLSKLELSLNELDDVMDRLVDAQKEEDDARVIRLLYPLDFLHALAELEERRRAFLVSGRDSDEDAYEAQLATTIEKYARAVTEFRYEFSRMVEARNNAEIPIARLSGVTTPKQMLAVLSGLVQGAVRVRNEHERRKACTGGNRTRCNRNDLILPPLPEAGTVLSDGTMPSIVREITTLLSDVIGRSRPYTYIALGSACVSGDAPHYVRLETEIEDKARGPRIQYVGDLFFLPTNDAEAPLLTYFRTNGITYSLYSVVNHYTCPEVGAVTGRVIAIAETARFARENPSVAEEVRPELLTDVLREEKAVEYLHTALGTLPEYRRDQSDRLVELAVMMQGGGAGFESIIESIVRVTNTDLDFIGKGAQFDPSPKHLFLTHSAFSSLFLAQNTFSGATTPFYIRHNDAEEELTARIKSYSELRTVVPREKLMHDIKLFLTLEHWI